MHPIRAVYPLAGFRILLAAYAESLRSDRPLHGAAFVRKYAQERFGMSGDDGKKLWRVLKADPQPVHYGKTSQGRAVSAVLRTAEKAQQLMATLKPKANRQEFDHLRLMVDIRRYSLAVKEIASRAEADGFRPAKAPALARRLRRILKDGKKIDRQFDALNGEYLKKAELTRERTTRNKPAMDLLAKLTRREVDSL